jgi:hypothetical protein
MPNNARSVTWWGRVRSIFMGHEWGWIEEQFPVGQTPYTHPAPHWHPPVDIWLPHPPVRGRRRERP